MTLPLVKRKKRKIKWCKHGVNKQKSAVKTIENNTLLIKICPKTRQVNTSFKNKFLTNNELIIQKGGKARKYSICAALGNFVPIVSYRNLSYLESDWTVLCFKDLKTKKVVGEK
ncbi:MAG: hypothetical protein ACLT8I_21490 [Blautia faecis]